MIRSAGRLSTQAAPAVGRSVASKLVHPRELEFLLREFLNVEALIARCPARFGHVDATTALEMIRAGHELAEKEFEPVNRLGDRMEPYITEEGTVWHPEEVVAAQKAYTDSGYLGMTLAEEPWGGLQLPFCVSALVNVPFSCASAGLMSYHGLTAGVIKLLLAHGSEQQRADWIPKLASGECYGTMCLSESHAGSSLTDIRTRATPRPDGAFDLRGSKMWITGGDQSMSESIAHLVLAKLPDAPEGVKGISLFLVPKHLDDGPNDVKLTGLNHKMGQTASTNAGELVFGDDAGAATGWLVGKEHEGLAAMFVMMNELRITVGMGAAATAVAGYSAALRYARDRPQGRDPEAPKSSPMVPIIEHSDVKRMLLAARSYAEGGLALCLTGAEIVDQIQHAEDVSPSERRQLELVLDLLIPIIKSWPSDWGLEANKLAIQVHGGAGYTRDYIVEQLYRDARVNMIYEGTNGIQSLDLLGRKVPAENGAALEALANQIGATIADAHKRGGDCEDFAARLRDKLDLVSDTTKTLLRCAFLGDTTRYLANSHDYMQLLGHVVVAWMWLKQAVIAADALNSGVPNGDGGDEEAFYLGKLHTARYFFNHELPKIDALAHLCASLDDTNPTMRNEWFF
ncbi:hypothetical protein CTAYLR_009235 [Chrysophaeum taylorii]|uniref:Acyl-CoA dehydrogenase n=1 Tax=Chrysophaeum taylorii TaxID=2483200 RepID=A0AAD7UEW8_9STRA|nr:hypothetical protein CTAYLR_009235 [Chrysophaeum taylorii]